MEVDLIKFNIPKCTLSGCSSYRDGSCWFHNRYIIRWIDYALSIQPNQSCKLKEQVSIYKTRELISS